MKENLKGFLLEEGAKLKEMSWKVRIDYIWEYYKIPIIGVLLIVILGGNFINSVFINPPAKPFVQIGFYGIYADGNASETLSNRLTDNLVIDQENEKVYFNSFYITGNDVQMDMALSQKFIAMLSAKELDIIITDELNFPEMCKDGFFQDLRLIFPEINLDDLGDRVLYFQDEESGENLPLGIKLDGNALLKSYGLPADETIMTAVITSQRSENAAAIMKYILDNGE